MISGVVFGTTPLAGVILFLQALLILVQVSRDTHRQRVSHPVSAEVNLRLYTADRVSAEVKLTAYQRLI